MNYVRPLFAGACLFMLASMPAKATYNAVIIGTVDFIQQMGPNVGYGTETITFRLTNQPNVSCGSFQYFVISPTTVADSQTRKNMLAILLTAKVSGAQLQVAYDNAGGYCDHGMPGVYYLTLR